MICPKCHTTFEIPANFCPNCGVSLQRGGGRLLVITSALVLLILIGVFGYVQYQFFQRTDAGVQTSICPNPDDLLGQRTDDLRVISPGMFQSTDQRLPIRKVKDIKTTK